MEHIAANSGARGTLFPSNRQSNVALVGFGLLGEAFAHRLQSAGCSLIGFDPSVSRQARMGEMGVASAPDLAHLARRADCVVVAVYDAAQAREALAALARGTTADAPLHVLCATTLPPEEVQALAASFKTEALCLIEMPVSGSSRQVTEGTALALLRSDVPLPARIQVLVDAMCPQQIRVPGAAAPARMKLVINLVLELNRGALAEGMTMAREFGLDPADVEAALRASAAASRVMEHQAAKMRLDDFRPGARLVQSLKDLETILDTGRARYLPLTSAARELLACANRHGEGALDSAAVVLELRRRQSRPPEVPPC